MLNKNFSKRNYFWFATLSFSTACLLGSSVATGNILNSVLTLVVSMALIFLGSWMSKVVLYPVIWIQFKNPSCPPSFHLGYCRFCAYFITGFSIVLVGYFLVISLSLGAESVTSEATYQVFSMPGFFFGAGIGAERVRAIFASKFLEL